MDNASNMDTFIDALGRKIPGLPVDARLRCLAHIVNLIAKVY